MERQRDSVDAMRKVMEEQMSSSQAFFAEERNRLREKQTYMDEVKGK